MSGSAAPGTRAAAEGNRIHPVLPAVAGPLLIVVSVLVVLNGFWLHPKLTNQQVDQLAFWLPRWCYLGENLAAGHLPTWLPNQFGGVPFLSDPQSGWLNAPAMLLFASTSCARALGLFVTLQPILAGLGLYLFFRKEGLGRTASTGGGLTLALFMAGSAVTLSVPFSAILAWTALALAGSAGFVHAKTWVSRLAWLAFTEISLSQVAATHMTDGLVIAGMTIGLYLVARSIEQVRAGTRTWGTAALQVALPFLILPILAAAVWIPRVALLPRTSIGHGYEELDRLARSLSGVKRGSSFAPAGGGLSWALAIARGPGGYAGAAALLLMPVAFASRRFRLPATAFGLAGVIGWVLNLDVLVSWPAARRFALSSPLGELWLRDPYRFRFLLPLAVGGLAGYGLQAWFDRWPMKTARDLRGPAGWLFGGLALFCLLPLLGKSQPLSIIPLLAGAAVVVPALLAAASGRRWGATVLPAVMAVELVTVALIGQALVAGSSPIARKISDRYDGPEGAFPPISSPNIDPGVYRSEGPIAKAILAGQGQGRYITFDPAVARRYRKWYLTRQEPQDWPAYANGRSVLFGLNEAQGYSPVQLFRYWSLVRRVNREAPTFYNTAFFQQVDPAVLRLLAVEWMIQPAELPARRMEAVAREGHYVLYRLPRPAPRVSVAHSWEIVPPGKGLDRVLDPEFDGERIAIVEGAGLQQATVGAQGPTAASYTELAPERVHVRVQTPAPALVVIRNPYDPNWVARVDGAPAEVHVADYLLQGVMVPAGTHMVELTYRDDTIGEGLIVSGAAWGVFMGAIGGAWIGGRKRRSNDASQRPRTELTADHMVR